MKKLLTIGVTLYNSKNYLGSLFVCFSSFLNRSDLSLIFVDDASTDSSLELAKELFGDSSIYIANTNNCGVSRSRNQILQFANSEYVTFLDADDTIDIDVLLKLLNLLPSESSISHPDIILSPYYVVQADNREIRNVFGKFENKIISSSEIIQMLFNYLLLPNRNGDFVQCFSKVYRLDYIQSNSIFFDESLKNCEDIMFLADFLALFPHVHTSDQLFYTHFVHRPGFSETCNRRRSLLSHFGFINAVTRMISTLSKYLKYTDNSLHLDHDVLGNLEAQAIAIYTSIALVQNCVKVVNLRSFCNYYTEVSSALSLPVVHNAFLLYDPSLAGGSQLFSFLVKTKCFFMVTLLCCWKYKRRYG